MAYRADYVEAVRTQPQHLRAALERLERDAADAALPPWLPGQTVAVVAMGASTHSAWVLGPVLADAGLRFANLTASEVRPGFQPADHYVLVSESGRSPEPIAAARGLTAGERVTISNFPEAQVAEVTDAALGLGGFDDSPVYTVGYTATLLAYAVLLRRQGVPADDPAAIPAAVEVALARYADVASHVGDVLAAARAVDCVGAGPSFATASETALMLREGIRVPAAAFDTGQYAHGPIEAAHDGVAVVLFGDGRELSLVEPLLAHGCDVVALTAFPERVSAATSGHLTVVPLPDGDGPVTRAAREVVVAQLALARAVEHRPFTIAESLYHDLDTKLEESAP
ncbi:SIS domain-containing protein [Xylanimonas sp. McL0601]|uniref:SIS domain-containing protein n=1 Tax=Xylanimonas sp. McL0601 TaxID=3414739 RepID=UPI003CF0ECA8